MSLTSAVWMLRYFKQTSFSDVSVRIPRLMERFPLALSFSLKHCLTNKPVFWFHQNPKYSNCNFLFFSVLHEFRRFPKLPFPIQQPPELAFHAFSEFMDIQTGTVLEINFFMCSSMPIAPIWFFDTVFLYLCFCWFNFVSLFLLQGKMLYLKLIFFKKKNPLSFIL